MGKIRVHIEYCGGWGYAPKAFALRDDIKAGAPDADVEIECEVGRSQSFEVKVNDQLIFSKFETQGFPINQDIVEQISKLASGGSAEKITTSEAPISQSQLLSILLIGLLAYFYKPILFFIQSKLQ